MNKIIYGFIFASVVFALCECEKTDDNLDDLNTYTSKQARSKKRGISFNILYEADFDQLKDGVSWAFNWGANGYNSTLTDMAEKSQIAYFPMFWDSLNIKKKWEIQIREYKRANPDCMYILAYNEPNLINQANMTPAEAAEKWPQIKDLAQELKMKIVAPAMNYGTLPGYGDPIEWLDDFFAQPNVSVNDVDALALHCYVSNPSSVKAYVERFNKYNKPLWITEFSAGEGRISAEQQRSYMCDMLNYFEREPVIERYAWFKYDGDGTDVIKNSHSELRPMGDRTGELTELGKVYIYFSSRDTELYYTHNQVIPAEHYSNCNTSDVMGSLSIGGPQLKVSSDITGILEVSNIGWVEYLIDPAVAGNYHLIIRYASPVDSKITIHINGNEIKEIDLPKTGDGITWATFTTPTIPLGAGKQTIRITPSDRETINLNWWRYKK